jgi:hypothetical protein
MPDELWDEIRLVLPPEKLKNAIGRPAVPTNASSIVLHFCHNLFLTLIILLIYIAEIPVKDCSK